MTEAWDIFTTWLGIILNLASIFGGAILAGLGMYWLLTKVFHLEKRS